MRNGEGGTVPSYNVQLVTDTQHGLVVNVEATTDAIDYRQLDAALERCETKLGAPLSRSLPTVITRIMLRCRAPQTRRGFLRLVARQLESGEKDAQGRRAAFVSRAFPYDPEQDVFVARRREVHRPAATQSRARCTYARVSRTERNLQHLCAAETCAPPGAQPEWRGRSHARRTARDNGLQSQNADRSGATDLCATFADRRVRACLD